MPRGKEFPDDGELVVGTVKDVQNFGAMVTLEQYPGKEGFIHIAEVATGWVKRIRDYVREHQRVVCKVLTIDETRGHIDLSLKRVNEHQKREKIQEWKNEQKAEKLLEIVAERAGMDVDKAWDTFGQKLVDKFGTLYAAFEECAYDPEALKGDGFKGKWFDALVEVCQENITIPFVDIKGFVELRSDKPDGIKAIREALMQADKSEFEDVTITAQYVGAPLYRIKVRAPDFKVAEAELEKAAGRVLKVIEKRGGRGAFHRDAEEEGQ
jgi:translation initiation factor 2 subunit 1